MQKSKLPRRRGGPNERLVDPAGNETYAWDHRHRLTKVERYVDAALAETAVYRYDASNDLIYHSVDPAGAPPAVVEYYVVESGQRTLTVETDGDVKRRYGYGPTGEVLFEQQFDATGNPTLQAEQDLYVPLGDHQHTTRVVLAHAGDDSTYVRRGIAGLSNALASRPTPAPSRISPSINNFTTLNNLGNVTRVDAKSPGSMPTPDPRFNSVAEGMRISAFREKTEAFHRDNGPGGKNEFRKNRSYLDDPF